MVLFVDSASAMLESVAFLRDHDLVALDTETDAFFAYRPKICLLQFSAGDRDFVIDPLAGLDLDPIGALIGHPEREVVLHAAENDVILMHHQYGWRIANLFDTQVASFVLGLKPYSLAGILEARFDVKLDKSQQRSDWRQRPLLEKQLAYAAEDTSHLPALAADLRLRAEEAGRVAEIRYECGRIARREWEPEPFDPEGFRRLSGARDLRGTAERLLKDLYLLRHKAADKRDRAPYRIISDAALVALARNPGKEPPRGVPPAFWRRYGSKVLRLAEDAKRGSPLPPPKRKRGSTGEKIAPAVKGRYERLRRWRGRAAEERGVEPFVVARNELLMRIATAAPATLDELGKVVEPFRADEYGEAILSAMLDSGATASDNKSDNKGDF